MSVIEKYVSAGRTKDLDALSKVFHEDYMYLAPDYLETKESILEEFKKSWVENTFANYDLKLIHEDKDTMIITFIEEDFRKGTKDFVTEVLLLKDSQIFRSASKTEPID